MKENKMQNFICKKLILILAIISTLIKTFKSGEILLDNQNPLQINSLDTNEQITKLDFRFSFPENSRPLEFDQFFGVAFPNELGSELLFDIGSKIKFDCKLTEINSGLTYNLIPLRPSSVEPNYIYCKFNDRENNKLKNGKKYVYKLSVTLNQFKISTNYIKNFWLFTSTSNDLNKIILDYSMKFGTFAIFPEIETRRNSAFNLLTSLLLQNNNPLVALYPYTKFDISLLFESNIFMNSTEFNLMIKYPKKLISPPNQINSVDHATNKTEFMGLKGNLTISEVSEGYLQVQGIKDTLTPGGKYKINLIGFIAKDDYISIEEKLEILLFYKNTYTVIGYMSTPKNLIKIIPSIISLKADHPESFDIWRNALWPMTFKFTLSGNDLEKGGYILLQHSNAKDKEIKWNFVASTCDFSESEGFDNSFGKRPVCNPLRTDFEYINSSAGYYPGSAVFFKVDRLKSLKEIKFTIWGSADNCGGNSLTNLQSAINPNFAFRKFNFKIFVFSKINPNKINEARLISEPNRNLIAESPEIIMENKCWNNIISAKDFTAASKKYSDQKNFDLVFIKENIEINNDVKGAEKDVNLFREFYNFELSNEKISNPSNLANLHLKDITQNDFKKSFIYGDNSLSEANSYFSLRLPFLALLTTDIYPQVFLPLNTAYNSVSTKYEPFPGRLNFIFSKNWFEKGSDSCYISWGLFSKDIPDALVKDKALIIDDSSSLTTSKNNWISNNPSNPNGWMDIEKTCILKDSCTKEKIKITSKHNTGMVGTANQFSYFNDAATELIKDPLKNTYLRIYAYFFTPCLKWIRPASIKSLYYYFDFQVQWLYSKDNTTEGPPNRNLRMVKLFPEAGVFNDNSKSSKVFNPVMNLNSNDSRPVRPNQVEDKTFLLHYALGSSSSMTGICLIEISGESIMSMKHQNSNYLVMWIGFGVLLESDYEDLNSFYPLAPINYSTTQAWGFQSGYLMNKKENLNLNADWYSETSSQKDTSLVFRQILNNFSKTGVDSSTAFFDYSITDDENKIPNNIFTDESSYYFLMGSSIFIYQNQRNILDILPGEKTYRNLLIPIYCPIKNDDIYFNNGIPSLYMTSISAGAYNSISSIDKIFSVNINNNAKAPNKLEENKKSLYKVIITSPNSGPASEYYRSSANQIFPQTLEKTKYENYLITLRWALYGSSSPLNSDYYVYLYIGGKSAQENSTAAPKSFNSAHILLIKDDLEINEKLFQSSFNANINDFKGYNKKNSFYFLGKNFNNAIFLSHKQTENEVDNMLVSPLAIENSKNFFVGIKRPLIESYYSNGKFVHAFDKIGYFGVDKINKENFSNYIFFDNSYGAIFLLDYNIPSTNTDFKISITSDKPEKIYKKDTAANLRIVASMPNNINVPAGSSINFSFKGTIVNKSSICGMIDKENIVSECTINSANLISCESPIVRPRFEICCYNISYLGMISGDSIILNSLNLTVPPYPNSFFTGLYSTNILKENSASKFYWNTQQSSSEDLISFKSAYISEIKYTHVTQNNGIGKVKFTILLPREINRNMVITIYGDLKEMYIPNSLPRCVANTGTSNSGDILLENCDISSLGKYVDGIKIYTKNKIYKCGLSFSNKFDVYIWPIKTLNFSIAPYNKQNMKVLVKMNNPTNDNLVLNNSNFNIVDKQIYEKKPLLEDIWENLCPINSIYPRIPGEYADYFIALDLDSHRKVLEKNTPNEFSLFFPFKFYSGNFEEVFCYNNENLLNCSFSDEGILNIRLPLNLQIGIGEKLEIRITHIFNPSIDTSEILYFPCTINYTNFSNEKRINLITGSGKLSNGITLPKEANKIGSLRFIDFPIITNKNPRELSNLSMKIGLDTFDSQIKFPLTVNNFPKIIINLPSEYKLDWYNNNKLSAEIFENFYDVAAKIIKKAEQNIKSAYITQNGNKITINLGVENYTFSEKFEFFEITLINLINPPFATEKKNEIWSKATKPLNIIITNSDFSVVFKNCVNTDNAKTFDLGLPKIDNWINFYRGLEFNYDDKKWIIDIGDNFNNSENVQNVININSGRYVTSHFTIKNPLVSLAPKSLLINLIDPIFKLYQQNILITTSSREPIPFLIGAPCGSKLGKYITEFNVINDNSYLNSFAPLNKIIINLSNTKVGEINYINPIFVPLGGSSYIYIKISEPNFDVLNLTFENDETVRNDPSSEITKISIPPATKSSFDDNMIQTTEIFGVFSMKNSRNSQSQIFKMKNPNACFNWLNNIIKIEISGKISNFPENFNFAEKLKYMPYEKNSKDFPVKNMLKFTFSPPNYSCYLHCALVCNELNFPSDVEIRNGKSNTGSESPILKFFNSFITKNELVNLVFDNLMRNQKYKIRCLLNSIEGDENKRIEKEIIISNYNQKGEDIYIKTQPQDIPKCVNYFFKGNQPSDSLQLAMLNSCQNLYTSKGDWKNNGCMVCTDSDVSQTPSGYSLPMISNCGKIMLSKNNLATIESSSENVFRFLSEENYEEKSVKKNKFIENFYLRNSTYFESRDFNKENIRRLMEVSHEKNLRFLQENDYFIYTICPISFQICPSDISDKNSNNTYGKLFTEFFNKFNSTENLKKNLPEFSNENITLENVYEINDQKRVDISLLKFNFTSVNINGNLTWESSYQGKVNCYYIIGEYETTFTKEDIFDCMDPKKCGSFKSNEILNRGGTVKKYWNPLFASKDYGLSIVCFNDVPYPLYEYWSDVNKYKLHIQQMSNEEDIKTSDNSVNKTLREIPSKTQSGNFLRNDMVMLILCYLIFFIL